MVSISCKKNRFSVIGFLIILFLTFLLKEKIYLLNLPSLNYFFKNHYLIHTIGFTFFQSILSTFITIILAINISRALHRNPKFLGRELLLWFFNISFSIAPIVLVIGLITLYGKNGWLNDVFKFFNFNLTYKIYGLKGILLAHIFLNLPYAVRIILIKLESINDESWKLASSLSLTNLQIFKIIEWPILRTVISSVNSLIFLNCFTSFAIILILGASPKFASLETLIFQALKFDFDISKALYLSMIQFVICTIIILFNFRMLNMIIPNYITVQKRFFRPDKNFIIDTIFIFSALIIIVLPVVAVIYNGFNEALIKLLSQKEFWLALKNSIIIAFSSAILMIILSILISYLAYVIKFKFYNNSKIKWLYFFGSFNLLISPFIIVTCVFFIVGESNDLGKIALYLIIIINAFMVLPYMCALVIHVITSIPIQEIFLARSLQITIFTFIKNIIWPKLFASYSYLIALTLILSLGDYGISALFGSNELITLPIYLYNKMGDYRINEASAISLIIMILSLLIFIITQKVVINVSIKRSRV
jgi:thiamine transport system permease protein